MRYVDSAEISSLDVALNMRTILERETKPDLLELHAHLMLGVTASLIPFLQANQSPRNAYQTSMGQTGIFGSMQVPLDATSSGWRGSSGPLGWVSRPVLCPKTVVCSNHPEYCHGRNGMWTTHGTEFCDCGVPIRSDGRMRFVR